MSSIRAISSELPHRASDQYLCRIRTGCSRLRKALCGCVCGSLTSGYLGQAIFASILHQDPRYFYQGSGSTQSRLLHALGWAVIARSDSGHSQPNYSYLLGDLASAALSNLYYPPADRGAGLVFANFTIGIARQAADGPFVNSSRNI
jgi:hypothetical protein